ncbi:hypothetical protein [Pontibacter roseus]|uniref:hypothetical protein n=1 Tax=Pontibacter roseus TaxID=336989 RepID=UPI00035EBAFB|nr:hypothetical protein [Pontibacter roseus]
MGRLLFFMLSVLLSSCYREESGQKLVLIKDACKRNIFQNETLTAGLNDELDAAGMMREDSLLKADLERIVSWRRGFVRNPTIENLLLFSDSIEHAHHKSSSWGYDYSAPVSELREQIESPPDSMAFYSLLYYATAGEGTLLQLKAAQRGAVNLATWNVSSYLDKSRYRLGDTVFLTVSTAGFHSGESAFDFSQITCRNLESGVTIKPKIVKSGPHYILMYTPDTYGAYEVTGGFHNRREDNFGYSLKIRNGFEVNPTVPDRG